MKEVVLPQETSGLGGFAIHHTPEEFATLQKLYDESLPKRIEKEVRKAVVTHIERQYVLVDLGGKSDGVLSLTEFRDIPGLKVGDEVEVYVAELENKKGEIVVSRKMAKLRRAWEKVQKARAHGDVLEAVVKRKIPGGLEVRLFDSIKAFLPGSQVKVTPVTDFEALVDTTLEVMVVKINKNNVVVSSRMVLEKEQEKQLQEIFNDLQGAQVYRGIVRGFAPYGVFVDLIRSRTSSEDVLTEELKSREKKGKGITGLIPLSEVTWDKRLKNPAEAKDAAGNLLFELGKEIEVVVRDVNLEKKHITLSTKALLPNPWAELPAELQEKSEVKGRVVDLMEFGAFVEIQKGVIGLLHVSNMSADVHVEHPKDVLKVGDEVDVVVLTVDRTEQDLRLGIRQLVDKLWDSPDFQHKYGVDTRHRAKVFRLINTGAYLKTEEGVSMFLHNKNLSWTQKIQHPSEFLAKDQDLEVVVLSLDSAKKLLLVGVRELQENPWVTFPDLFPIGSIHKGIVRRLISGGAIIELPNGPQTFVPDRDLVKEDKTPLVEGEELEVKVVDCIPEEQKMLLSHVAVYKKDKEGGYKSTDSNSFSSQDKSTLGDLMALQMLKSELEAQNKQTEPKRKKAKSVTKDE